MALIDSLLNLVGLLLWLSATGFGAVAIQRQPLTLASNLRPVTKVVPRGWPYMAGLLVLLLVRGLFYWNVGRSLGWVAVWSPGPMSVMFRSDYLLRMVVYSFLSFGWILMMVYGSMALLAALHRDGEPGELIGRVVREHLGWLGRLPAIVLLLLQPVLLLACWPLIHWALMTMGLLSPVPDFRRLAWQSGAVALGGWISLRWVISLILLAGMVLNHVYVGAHPIWEFAEVTARRLMSPLRWLPLRLFQADFLPLVLLIVVWVFSIWCTRGLPKMSRLGLHHPLPPLLEQVYRMR